MNATGSSDASIVLPLLLLGLALVGAFAAGGALWLLFALGALVYLTVQLLRSDRSPAATGLSSRVEFLERRVTELQAVVDELRAGRPARAASPAPPRPDPAAPTAAPLPKVAPAPPPRPKPEARPEPAGLPPVEAPGRSFDWGRAVSTVDLLGAKALAFAGGVVTLLGVIFFFVLAVNRGWIGPEIRVASGGVASAILIGAGLWLKRRYGTTYSALAGVAVSLAWSAEIVAAFGLIGAMVVPATLVFQGGLQEIGTAFVAVVFAGAAVVAVRERWWRMLQVAALVSVPQAIIQIADAGGPARGHRHA